MNFDFKCIGKVGEDLEKQSIKYKACVYLLYDYINDMYYGGATVNLSNRMYTHASKLGYNKFKVFIYYSNLNSKSIRKRENELLSLLNSNLPKSKILNKIMYSSFSVRSGIKGKIFNFYEEDTNFILSESENSYHNCIDEGINRSWATKSWCLDEDGDEYDY